jgi:SAM-dependent methyltransferase
MTTRAGARAGGERPDTGSGPPFDGEVAWHDVECAGYESDLPLWRELAEQRGGPVLELGAGSGRVSLDLAARGHDVVALDVDPRLVDACAVRARERDLRVEAVCADARTFALDRRFALVVAPMQVVQLLEDADGRDAMLARVLDHLVPGGLFAPALADPFAGLTAADALPPLPDVGEREGWTLSSTPVAVREEAGGVEGAATGRPERTVAIDRVRHASSPTGETFESASTTRLSVFPPDELAATALARGFRRLPDRLVPETDAYVGSIVLMLEAPAP